jgi:hypothetical protein
MSNIYLRQAKIKNIKITLIALLIFIAPQSIWAAELNFNVKSDKAGDNKQTVVEVRVNPQSKRLNLIEGKIKFTGSMTEHMSVQVENGNSVLSIWPVAPIYNEKDMSISFMGGKPDGFQNEGLLFILKITSSGVGNLNISYADGSVYLNDGKGTKESVYSKSVQVNSNQDGLVDVSVGNTKLVQESLLQYDAQQINSDQTNLDQINQGEEDQVQVRDLKINSEKLFLNQNTYAILLIIIIALFSLIIYEYKKTKK